MSARRSVQVRGLWDAHDSEERGYLERKELEDLLGHLRQKLGGSGDLSPEAVKRCAEELHFDEESGELRQEVFGRRFQQFWAKKEELLELFQPKAVIVEGDGDMEGDAASYVAGDAASGAADVTSWLTSNMFSIDDALCFPEGTACWARDALVMTEKEDLKSAIIKEVPGPSEGHPSIRLFVIECGRQDASRLCVKDASGDVGWVSAKSKDGRPLLRPVSSWLTMAEPQHGKDAVHREVRRIWKQHRHAQEQGADLASELLAAHHQALTQDARNWCKEQEIEQLEDDLDQEDKACRASRRKVKEIEQKLANEMDMYQQQQELKLKHSLEENSEFARTKTRLLEAETEAGKLRLQLEDSRAATHSIQQEQKRREEQRDSRLASISAVMQDEVNKSHERLALSEMALTAAQRSLQIFEEDEETRVLESANEMMRIKERVRAEAAAFDQCEFKLESIEKREKTRSLFENVQVEFHHKEKKTNDEMREATQLRNEAAQAADEALALRIKLAREEQDLTSRHAFLAAAEHQAVEKLESASIELDRARLLTQELTKDKAEAFSELSEAKRVSRRAQEERELAHQQSMEAEMAAYEAMKACKAAEDDRKKVEHALLLVTEDLEKAARQHKEGYDLALKGEASLRRMQAIEAQVAQYSDENRQLSQVLATERAACAEYRTEQVRHAGLLWRARSQRRCQVSIIIEIAIIIAAWRVYLLLTFIGRFGLRSSFAGGRLVSSPLLC